MTDKEKFKAGMYKCPTPRGDTSEWTVKIWIDYINKYGRWL